MLEQSIFGRMLGFGDLRILTASEAAISDFKMLVRPVEFKKAMLEAKHEYERDVAGGSYDAGPPLRTAPVGTFPPASPDPDATSVTAAPAAAPDDDPDEIARTLANLADLRDRGAISAEEYEAKKQDLLSRL